MKHAVTLQASGLLYLHISDFLNNTCIKHAAKLQESGLFVCEQWI